MTHKTITLNVPDELYKRVQEAAEASDCPVETVLLESLDLLFRDRSVESKRAGILRNDTDSQKLKC